MRVKRRSGILLVMLLALGALAPAAGAIYIEGQTIPDDGMMHIMSAEDGAGTTAPAGMPVSIPADTLPSYVWDDTPYTGYTGLTSGFPASTLPLSMLPFDAIAPLPAATVPPEVANPAGDVIENSVSPAITGIWNFDKGSPQTNMPVLSSLFF